MDILRDSLPGAQFRIVDGALYLDFTVNGKRPVGICLTSFMRGDEQTCRTYDEWETAKLSSRLQRMQRAEVQPFNRRMAAPDIEARSAL
jgi:hypothetical protein